MINEYKKICDQVAAIHALTSLLPNDSLELSPRELSPKENFIENKVDEIFNDIVKSDKAEDTSIIKKFVDFATEQRGYDKETLEDTFAVFLTYLEKGRI